MTALCSKTRDTEEKNFKTSKAFLFRELFPSLWIRIKMLKTFCKRVIGKFRFQKKGVANDETRDDSALLEDSWHSPTIQTCKNKQNSQNFEIKLHTQNFLQNIRQPHVYCYGKKLISTRLTLASTHIEAIIDSVVSYLYEFPFLVFVHIKWRKKIRLYKKLIFVTFNEKNGRECLECNSGWSATERKIYSHVVQREKVY